MAKATTRNHRLGRLFALGTGMLLVCGLMLGLEISSEAAGPKQNTKAEKDKSKTKGDKSDKGDKKTPEPKPEPKPKVLEPVSNITQVKEINAIIGAQWKANKITPSSYADDYAFIRRASLDIVGRIATPAEIDQYMKDDASTRRSLLVERLLNHKDYATFWANNWTTWLMTRGSTGLYREQMQMWLEEKFSEKEVSKRSMDTLVRELLTANGENNENGAVNFILSHLGEATPAQKVREEGKFNFVPITSRVTRLFLGTQIQCTQCHDHPFNPEWKQKAFWGVNAFFRQVDRIGNPNMRNQRNAPPPVLALKDDKKLNVDDTGREMVLFENRNAEMFSTRASFLDGRKFNSKKSESRREQLAEFVVTHKSFPKAFVNRMWGQFFGRGLTQNGIPFDDFGQHNPEVMPLSKEDALRLGLCAADEAEAKKLKVPVYDEATPPTLLDYLGREFRSFNHDPKEVIRWICNSKAYNLSCVADGKVVAKDKTRANDAAEDEPFFSRMQLKAMSPEQLFESIWVSTYASVNNNNDERKKLREEWMRELVVNFGDDEGNEMTFNGTVVQALMLMNGKKINDAISHKDGLPAKALARANGGQENMNEMFLATLNRKPTKAEVDKIMKDCSPRLTRPTDQRKYVEGCWQDIFWALLNSSEFILNH